METLPGFRVVGTNEFEVDESVPEELIRDRLPAYADIHVEYDMDRAQRGVKVVRLSLPRNEHEFEDGGGYDGRTTTRYSVPPQYDFAIGAGGGGGSRTERLSPRVTRTTSAPIGHTMDGRAVHGSGGTVRRESETDAELRHRILARMLRYADPDEIAEVETATDEHLRSLATVYSVDRPPLGIAGAQLETATGEHLRSLADLYGVDRLRAIGATVNVILPGSIDRLEITARFVSDPPARTAWERLLDDDEAAA